MENEVDKVDGRLGFEKEQCFEDDDQLRGGGGGSGVHSRNKSEI